jgi:hypothetical protein
VYGFSVCNKKCFATSIYHETAAGKKWLRSFLKGLPAKPMENPEGISADREKGSTLENVVKLFDNYKFELRMLNHPN